MPDPIIIKGDGEKEVFDVEKLKRSLLRAHATVFVAQDIANTISKEILAGMTTKEIYERAFSLLRKKSKQSAIRYSLRRSILNLGPSGFPFETYVAQLFAAKGYSARTGQRLQGRCLEHEVDIVAWNNDDLLLAEAKFHNDTNMKSDTKVALYIKARFDDLASETYHIGGKDRKMTRGILVTNTKFTENAKQYARCVGSFDMISWEYPAKGNLYDLIEETKLHPMTCVPLLSQFQKQELLRRGIINCVDLKKHSETMREIGVHDDTIKEVVENINMICAVEPEIQTKNAQNQNE